MDFIIKEHHVLERHAAGCIPLNSRKEDCHMHIFLVWFNQQRITPDQIDQIISAEIPDKHIDPNLFERRHQKYDPWPLVAHSTVIHHACLMGNARNVPKENWFPILSLAMTDIHCTVDDPVEDGGNSSCVLKVRNIDIE
ncbi:hypothetical protein TNCV_4879651 [Trichonephila clavipes]|nr:hypothetical protein TNCV_4879651 [Trichonephila clavipes]